MGPGGTAGVPDGGHPGGGLQSPEPRAVLFADDTVLATESPEALQRFLSTLDEE